MKAQHSGVDITDGNSTLILKVLLGYSFYYCYFHSSDGFYCQIKNGECFDTSIFSPTEESF